MPGAQAASGASIRHDEILRSPTHSAGSKGMIHGLVSVRDPA